MAAKRQSKVAAILGALGASVFYLVLASGIPPARNQDFLNLYTGGQLARTGHWSTLYDLSLQSREQDRIAAGVRRHFPFVRPPFYALVLSPLSLVPFETAYRVWIGVNTTLFLCISAWGWRRFGPESIIYCALFLPAALGIAHGQDCMVLAVLGLGALEAAERRKDGLAGVLFASMLMKFHLFLLVPLAIAARRRWRMLGAYIATAAVLGFVSIAMVGAAGVRGYIGLLTRQDLDTLSPSPERMIGVQSIAANLGAGSWFVAALAIGVAALALKAVGRSDAEEYHWIAAALAASLLLSPHTYQYDAAVLLAFAVTAVSVGENAGIRSAAMLVIVPVPYLATLAGSPWAIAPSLVVLALLVALSGLPLVKASRTSRLPTRGGYGYPSDPRA